MSRGGRYVKGWPVLTNSRELPYNFTKNIGRTAVSSERINIEEFARSKVEEVKAKVGGGKALCALSGGVDSSVCAAIMSKAIGKNLTCIFVDTGLMRLNEADEVRRMFDGHFEANLIMVDAEARFLDKLSGVVDPESKRKIIGEEFIRVFEEEAGKIGSVDFLVQGTILPDIIESGVEGHALVKSHHNVGGLPDVIDFKEIIEPVRDLYKHEVRRLGVALGLPEAYVARQPFPGPGLSIRVIGEVTKEKLDTLRRCDYIFRDEVAKAGLAGDIWQYFAVLTDLRSVGAKNGVRTYGRTVALRAVNSVDAMTADWVRLPYDLVEKASARIVGEVENITRVVYDVTPKPPSTIEWE